MAESDQLLRSTCEAIVTEIAKAIDAEPLEGVRVVRVPGGPEVGQQITVDASEGGLMNVCRLAILNADLAPAEEVARIEYEHDKQGKFGQRRTYSIQSVRRRGGELVLLENFLAEDQEHVREEDFRPISSEAYAQESVLKSVQDWAKYRAWQRQEANRKQ